MFPHETPTYRAGRRETVLVIVGAGQGPGVLPISTWSRKMGGSGFPDVLPRGSGSGGGGEGWMWLCLHGEGAQN